MAMGARMASTDIPPELLNLVSSVMGDWNPPITIDQEWVDNYTNVTRDGNPVHKAGWHSELFPEPIAPALMVLSISDGLFEGGIRSVFPGRLVLFRQVSNFRTKRSIKIGQQIQLRYRIAGVDSDPGGIYTDIEVEMRTVFPAKIVAFGTLSFYLREE